MVQSAGGTAEGGQRPKAAGPRAALRVGAFRVLLAVQLVNATAVWVQVVGVQWLLTTRGESATVVALAPAAMAVPFLVLAMPVGVVVSHAARERLLAQAMTASAIAAAVAAALAVSGADSALALLLTVVVIGSALVVVGVAWQSLLPELLERRLVPAAVLLDGAVFNMARAIGPLAAGVVLGLASPVVLFATNAAAFAGCAALLVFVGTTVEPRPPRTESIFAAVRGALWFVRHSPWTGGLLLRMVAFGLPASALWALVSLVVHDRLEMGAAGFGVVMALLGAGSVAAALFLGRLRARISVHGFVASLATGYATTLAVLGVATEPWVLVPFLVLGGVGWVAVQSTWMMLAHQALPDWVRPRVVALLLMLFQGTQAVGALVWGAVADQVGVGPALVIASAVLAAYATALVVAGMRSSAGIEPVPAVTELPAAVAEFVAEHASEGRQHLLAGPVTVRFDYRVAEEARDQFVAAMSSLRLSRLRLGARSWSLEAPRDPEPDDGRGSEWVETYVVRDAALLVEQETARLTAPEQRVRDAVRAAARTVTGPVVGPEDSPPPDEDTRRFRRRGGRA